MIEMKPIGHIRNGVTEAEGRKWEQVVSELVIEDEHAERLEGLEEFSHILVLFWMDRVPPERRAVTRVHPEQRQDLPLVGVFATRSPARPNPIGLTAVSLLERKGGVLRVKGLDALDGSPILDLKPWLPSAAPTEDIRTPDWVARLAEERRG